MKMPVSKTGAGWRTRCASFTWHDVRRRPLRPHEYVLEVDGTKALESDLQRYGYSRDKRGDCLQVVVALDLTPRQIIGKFRAVKMVDVVMPTTDGRIVTLPRYVEPKPDLAVLLDRLGLTLPAQPPPKISSEAADAAKSTV